MEKLQTPKVQVDADEMFSDGVKTYVISKGKMASVALERPAGEKGLLEFFKTHADTVIDNEQDVPVVKLDAGYATEQK